MSASAFLQIQGAIVAALQAAPALAGVPVYTNRTRAIPREELAAVLVRLESSRDMEGQLGVSDWLTAFEVEVVARGATGTEPAAAVDELMQSVWAELPDLSIPGVIDMTADPQIDWAFDAGDTPLASALFRVSVLHRTEPNTLTPRA